MMLGFVGTDTTNPSEVRATNAANAKVGGQVESFGSASDIARLRLQDVDEAGLSTDFKTVNFTLTNNVAGEKVIAKMGPKYLNAGDIEVDIEEIGRAHVCTPVTNAHTVCSILREKSSHSTEHTMTSST